MRTLRLLLLTGTVLPGLLSVPASARAEGASGTILLATILLAQGGPDERGPRGGGREGPPGGGGREGPPGGPPPGRERPEPRPERAPPAERPAPQERAAPPAARERPDAREDRAPAPRPQERPQPAERPAPPPARERPDAREDRAPAARPQERPQPAERQAPPPPDARERTPDRAPPPATAPARRDAPDTVTRPPAAEAPAGRTPPPAQPGKPAAPPPGAPNAPNAVDRPAPNAAPGVPGRPVQQPGARPGEGGPQDRATPPGPPPGQPGAVPPNARPGVPGRPVQPPGAPVAPDTVEPQGTGRAPGRPGGPDTPPNAAPGVPGRPVQPPGAAGQPNPGQPGFNRPGAGGPGAQPGQPGYDPHGVPTGRVDDQGGFNRPGRPGYVPGGFNADNEDVRDYETVRRDRRAFDEDGRTYIREPGRIIVRDRDNYFIRHDENERFRDLGGGGYRSERRGPDTYTYLDRPGGEQIVTVVDDDGRMLRRYRRFSDGREVVLIDNAYGGPLRPVYDDVVDLPPPDIRIPRDRYVVDYGAADERAVYEALSAPPVVAVDRRYTLDQVRYSPQLRARMRSVDIDTITFDTASFTVTPDQAARLSTIAAAINQAIRANPQEVFLIEGYTDAVGSDVDNLSLSDRRAQSVATVLTQNFQVPPENLTTQGYGEQYLKVNTQNASRENRRVTVRRITPLLQQGGAAGAAPPR